MPPSQCFSIDLVGITVLGMLITWAHGQVALEVPPVAAGVAAPGSASASCEHVASGHSEAPAATAAGDGHSPGGNSAPQSFY